MTKIRIDLQHDPLIPAGRALIRQLVGAHLSASDEEELLHMVGAALTEVHSSGIGEAVRILAHATYRAQEMIVRLLDTAAERGVALAGETADSYPESVSAERLRIWHDLKEELGRGPGPADADR